MQFKKYSCIAFNDNLPTTLCLKNILSVLFKIVKLILLCGETMPQAKRILRVTKKNWHNYNGRKLCFKG